jgi:uncharacterized circularly permuted ATP-grasp superfamily protein
MVWQNVAKKALFVVLIMNYQMKERITLCNQVGTGRSGKYEKFAWCHALVRQHGADSQLLSMLSSKKRGSHDRCRCPSEIHRLRDISLPSSTPIVTAAPTEQ